jgi:hypothetical protein
MDTIIQPSFTVGALQGPFANGAIVNMALGPHAEGLVSQLDAPYRMGNKNGEMFFGCNQAATTTTIALAATYTGLAIGNPSTSKKNLSILKVSCSLWAAPGGIVAVGLIVGWAATGIVTHTTPAVVYGAKSLALAVPSSGATADAAATLVGTPIWAAMLTEANTSAALPVAGAPVFYDIAGAIEIPPGGYIAVGTQTVASVVASILWREVDP